MEDSHMAMMKISSTAFTMNGSIPSKYTCDGMDINPPLTIENVPTEAKSLVLIMDDPDAPGGMWVHWVVWNIDPAAKEIKENSVPPGSSQGMTDFRKQKYGGPCPPSGVHRYFFKLYALSSTLTLDPNAGKVAVEQAMKGCILAQTELIGLYTRKK
jgi:hypothetical protein